MIPVSVAPRDKESGSFGESLASQVLCGRHQYRSLFDVMWRNFKQGFFNGVLLLPQLCLLLSSCSHCPDLPSQSPGCHSCRRSPLLATLELQCRSHLGRSCSLAGSLSPECALNFSLVCLPVSSVAAMWGCGPCNQWLGRMQRLREVSSQP